MHYLPWLPLYGMAYLRKSGRLPHFQLSANYAKQYCLRQHFYKEICLIDLAAWLLQLLSWANRCLSTPCCSLLLNAHRGWWHGYNPPTAFLGGHLGPSVSFTFPLPNLALGLVLEPRPLKMPGWIFKKTFLGKCGMLDYECSKLQLSMYYRRILRILIFLSKSKWGSSVFIYREREMLFTW